MPQMKNAAPGAGGSGSGAKTAGEHVPTSVPRSWHDQAEREGQWWYAEGYHDGWAAAERAIAEEITRAIGVKPYDRRDVIRWLIRTIDQPREPYTSSANGTDLGVAERQMFGELGRAA